jgi:hypothetical protein
MRALDSFFESGGEMPGGDFKADMQDPDQVLTADQMRVLAKFKELNQAGNWPDLAAMEAEACATACELRAADPEDAAFIYCHCGCGLPAKVLLPVPTQAYAAQSHAIKSLRMPEN